MRFVQQPDGVFFTSRGGSANFSCAAVDGADKALPVKWTLNGRSLPSRVPLGVLRVVEASEDDEGVYRCVAQMDGVGAVLSKAGRLRLDRPARLRHHPTSQQVRIGQSVRFECVVDLVVWPLIHWLHNGLPLADDIRHTRYLIHHSQPSYFSGDVGVPLYPPVTFVFVPPQAAQTWARFFRWGGSDPWLGGGIYPPPNSQKFRLRRAK